MNKSTKYSKVLFILHMPPPVHGASMVGKYIHDSKIINNAFECHYLNLALAKDLDDIGTVSYTHLTLPTICSV